MSTRPTSVWWAWRVAAVIGAVAAGGDGTPRVMVLVDEKSLGTIPTSEVEAIGVRMLSERRVESVDQDMVRANLQRVQQALRGAGDDRGAAALGREFGADVIIVGEAVAKPSARRLADTNLRTYQAVVTLRAVRTDNSVNLASASEDVSVVGLDDVAGSAKALREAGRQAFEALIPQMLEQWNASGAPPRRSPNVAAGRPLDVTVGGVDQVWKLKAIRDVLRGRPQHIEEVTQRSYAQGLAVFRISCRVPVEELAEALVLQPPEGLKLQVVEMTPAALTLRAVEANP
ncbi:MAG: hypothetical protein N2652_07680 [Kiritimatiellae bacterium]|nr:hypothetical protein [Kiritimatiellia bacterium]